MSLYERWLACSEKHGWAALAARGQLGPWDAAARTPEPLACDEAVPRRVPPGWGGAGARETVVISSSSSSSSESEGEEAPGAARSRFVVISSDEDEAEARGAARAETPDVSPVRPRGSAAGTGGRLTQALEAITLDDDDDDGGGDEGVAGRNGAGRAVPQGVERGGTGKRARPHLQRLASSSSSSSSPSSSLSLSEDEDEDEDARYHDDSFVVDDDYCSFEEESEDSIRR